MAAGHAELQKATKTIFELNGWDVVENKKGKSSRNYKSGVNGIADLLAVRPYCNILWLEIKTKNDIQKPDQKIFQKEVEGKGHKYYLVYDVEEAEKIIELNNT